MLTDDQIEAYLQFKLEKFVALGTMVIIQYV